MVGGWTVKVIGISSRIRKPDLAAILKVSISDIVIPRHQQPGQNRFAYVNNFESEDKANDFAAQWDGVFIQLPLRICIKCEVVRTMVEPQLNITQSLCGISVLLGQDGILKLACGANPSPHIAWFFNGVEVKNSTKYNILSHGNVFTLTVHNCDRQDAGEYRAVITNGINRIEQAGMLRVKMRPTVDASEQVNKQSCVIDQDAQITWKFSGIEIPQVIWHFNGQPMETNDRIQVTGSADGRSTLTIRNTQLLDEGVYTARASNSVGTAEAQTILSIVGIPPVIVTDLEAELQVMREERVTFKLIVKGTPTPKIVWMRDNNELVLDKRVHVTQPAGDSDGTHTLIISNVQTEDRGQYSAKIENIAGSVKSRNCKVTVIQNIMPDKPLSPQEKSYYQECKQYYRITGNPLISISDEILSDHKEFTSASFVFGIDEDCRTFNVAEFLNKICNILNLNISDIKSTELQDGSSILTMVIAGVKDKIKCTLKVLYTSLTDKLKQELAKLKVFFMFMGDPTELPKKQKLRTEIKLHPQWNRIYGPGHTYWTGALQDGRDRGKYGYFCPSGWKRYALHVSENYDEKFKGWSFCYHGTKFAFGLSILLSGLTPARCAQLGSGIYASQSIIYASHPRYAEVKLIESKDEKEFFKNGRYVQFMLQCRVLAANIKVKGPETLCVVNKIVIDPNLPNDKLEWVIDNKGKDLVDFNDPNASIVCTGLMVRVTDNHPGLLPESKWWYEGHVCDDKTCCCLGINLNELKTLKASGRNCNVVNE